MNKKLLLHLCLIGCLTGIITKCPKTFEEIRVAAESETVDQVHRMLAKHTTKSVRSNFIRRINRELTNAYEKERTALLKMRCALTSNQEKIRKITELEQLKSKQNAQKKEPVKLPMDSGSLIERAKTGSKDPNKSPKLPLYSGTPFSIDGNNFRTWSDLGKRGEAPKGYGTVTIKCPTKAEASAGKRAVIIKSNKKSKAKD